MEEDQKKRASPRARIASASAGPRAKFLETFTRHELAGSGEKPLTENWPFLTDEDEQKIRSICAEVKKGPNDAAWKQISALVEKRIKEAWQQIEVAWDVQLTESSIADIKVIVDRYLEWEPFERNALFVDDVLRILDRLKKRGDSFWKSLLDLSDLENSDAAFDVRQAIRVKLDQQGSEERDSFDWLVSQTPRLWQWPSIHKTAWPRVVRSY